MTEDGTITLGDTKRTYDCRRALVESHASIRTATIHLRPKRAPTYSQFLRAKRAAHIGYGRLLIDASCDAEAAFRFPIRSYRVTFPPLNIQLSCFLNTATTTDLGEMINTLASEQDQVCTELQEYADCRMTAMLARMPDLAEFYQRVGVTSSRDVYSNVAVDLVDWPGDTAAVFEAIVFLLRTTNRQFACCLAGRGSDVIWTELSNAATAISLMGTAGAKFCVGYSIPPSVPFYPASYATDPGLSVGLSGAGALTKAIKTTQPDALEAALARKVEELLQVGFEIGTFLSTRIGLALIGIDPTQASEYSPTGRAENSVAAAIEALAGVEMGRPGTKRAFGRLVAGIRLGARNASVPLAGFGPGSFLSVAEDDRLALRVRQGVLTYPTLLDLTSICAAGLDMVVLRRGTNIDIIKAILWDVAESAIQKQRPLAARVIVPPAEAVVDVRGYVFLGGLLGAAPELSV